MPGTSEARYAAAAPPPPAAPKRRKSLRPKAWIFIAPYIAISAAFFAYPFFNALFLAFQQTNGPVAKVYVGLSNFAYILSDPVFYKALKNTAIFAFCSVFLQLPLSLGLAMLLNTSASRSKGFFRLLIFSPQLVGQIFVGVLFSVLFVPRFGLVNQFFQALFGWGLEEQWLQDPSLVMPALVLISLWMYVGFNMIYFLAALQNVDESLKEAAAIDGANAWQIFLNVTLPAIKPVATFVVVMSTIGSFQLFELPFALLSNSFGPDDAGLTIVGYLYTKAFQNGDLGTGAAVGWILTIIVFAVSLIQIKLSGAARED